MELRARIKLILVYSTTLALGVVFLAWLGFLAMFIVFSSIFIAVKQVRDEVIEIANALRQAPDKMECGECDI